MFLYALMAVQLGLTLFVLSRVKLLYDSKISLLQTQVKLLYDSKLSLIQDNYEIKKKLNKIENEMEHRKHDLNRLNSEIESLKKTTKEQQDFKNRIYSLIDPTLDQPDDL